MAQIADNHAGSHWKSHRATLECCSVDVVLIIVGRGPPAPPILRYGAIFCVKATQTISIDASAVNSRDVFAVIGKLKIAEHDLAGCIARKELLRRGPPCARSRGCNDGYPNHAAPHFKRTTTDTLASHQYPVNTSTRMFSDRTAAFRSKTSIAATIGGGPAR